MGLGLSLVMVVVTVIYGIKQYLVLTNHLNTTVNITSPTELPFDYQLNLTTFGVTPEGYDFKMALGIWNTDEAMRPSQLDRIGTL